MSRRDVKRLVQSALLLVARLTDRWRRGILPVLIYHSVDDSGSPVSTPSGRLRAHWDYLLRHGFHPISVHEAADLVVNGLPFPPRSVAITFDDGYRNNLEPIRALLRSGGRATLFLPAGRIGEDNCWDAGRTDIPAQRLMGLEEAAALAKEGCEIGGHGVSHADLTTLSPDDLRREAEGCGRQLESLLGQRVFSFAYPYGAYDARVVSAVREAGFVAACTTVPGYLSARASLMEIPRFPAGNRIDFLAYRLVLHRGYHWYTGLQRLFCRWTPKSLG